MSGNDKHSQRQNKATHARAPRLPSPTGDRLHNTEEPDLLALRRAVARPDLARPVDILALQRTVGNRAVQRLLTPRDTAGLTQRQGGDGGLDLNDETAGRIIRARAGGPSLASEVQAQMAEARRIDFGGDGVQTNARPDNLHTPLQAKAFPTSALLFFKRGAYVPGSSGARDLIAHEPSHVGQKGVGIRTGGGRRGARRQRDAFERPGDAASALSGSDRVVGPYMPRVYRHARTSMLPLTRPTGVAGLGSAHVQRAVEMPFDSSAGDVQKVLFGNRPLQVMMGEYNCYSWALGLMDVGWRPINLESDHLEAEGIRGTGGTPQVGDYVGFCNHPANPIIAHLTRVVKTADDPRDVEVDGKRSAREGMHGPTKIRDRKKLNSQYGWWERFRGPYPLKVENSGSLKTAWASWKSGGR